MIACQMRIAIVGAGAMGGIFGAGLHEAGHDVLLVDVSGALVERLNGEGVTIERQDGERTARVPATTDPAGEAPADAVVFFVKGYHTAAAAELAAPLVGERTAVASLQNGWGNEETLAGRFGEQRVVAGVTYNSGTVRDLGRIAHTGVGATLVGPYAEGASPEAARALAEALSGAGIETTATGDIRTEIWKKLILNAATLPTSALTGLSIAPLGEPGPMLDLVGEVAREATAAARAGGLEIDAGERVEAIEKLLARGGMGKASMLQDFEAGRRTEIDTVTGAVVREAERHGVDVPRNRALYALVVGYERAHGLR